MSADVVVYLTEWCPFCTRAKDLLGQKGVRFRAVDVDDRPELRAWLLERSGQRTVPQVFVNGRPLGGFTDISALDRKGELDRLLAVPPSPADAAIRL
jgi:glutaredoxin 3